jgi:hypothetical protein
VSRHVQRVQDALGDWKIRAADTKIGQHDTARTRRCLQSVEFGEDIWWEVPQNFSLFQ